MNEQEEYIDLVGDESHAWIQPSTLFGHKRNVSSSLLGLPEMYLQRSISVELLGDFGESEAAATQVTAKLDDIEQEDAQSEVELTPASLCQGTTTGRCCAKDQRIAELKRSRSAEVHNASERKRRDKITEKIKELQDLMPHSQKKDKASVLEEATIYVKTLQLQVESMTRARDQEWIAGYNMQYGVTPCMMPYGPPVIRSPSVTGMTFGQPGICAGGYSAPLAPYINAPPFSHPMMPGFPLPTTMCPPPLPLATGNCCAETNSTIELKKRHTGTHRSKNATKQYLKVKAT